MDIEKIEYVCELIDLYKNLLTAKQVNYLENFYKYNISLSEIAENENISRQAVKDLIDRSLKLLKKYEKKLNLLQKTIKIKANFRK
jgi:predicted DNA-binding protein YlxM (UPF0122 family)